MNGFRLVFRDDPAPGATPLPLPSRDMSLAGLIVGGMFVVFAGVEWMVASSVRWRLTGDGFDAIFTLFQLFWLLGWSVGVVALGALTALLFSYKETARLENGSLVVVPQLGPLKIRSDYDLSDITNLHLENVAGTPNVRIRFDHRGMSRTLGDSMPRDVAEELIGAIAATGSHVTKGSDPFVTNPAPPTAPLEIASEPIVALVAANLIPLAGVTWFGWDLADVMVLFWAESAIIAFYTAMKMTVVGKWMAVLAVPFFIGHFGGFMAIHFLFINFFFVHGTASDVFRKLWTAIAALAISHGISFVTNFIGRREYAAARMTDLMTAPYNRVVVMQLALIFGGWIVMLVHRPIGALVILVMAKTAFDLHAHRQERKRYPDR